MDLMTQVDQLSTMLTQSKHTVALTGAGISTPIGIPDLSQLPESVAEMLGDERELIRDPKKFYGILHRLFLDPITKSGPTLSHRVLAALERAGKLDGIVTTNVDYLHELAGSRTVADVWGSFNTNYCLRCGRTYSISALTSQAIPTCPKDGGFLATEPLHGGPSESVPALRLALRLMQSAELVIIVGSTGFYSDLNETAKVVQINPSSTIFDDRSDLNIRAKSDDVFAQLAGQTA
ncbi:SIR2 family NAD-dependent protein deacylase [Secundilactobacillus folii]|nr:Sir2 family NAD-dependent protein deacetylase [Secundilactobacillus folii]